jgi:hypothetical protein
MDETKDPSEDLQADGYYGEDELDADELDLSFLDEEDDEVETKAKTPDKAA